MADVVWVEEAEEDLERISEYYQRYSENYTRLLVTEIIDSVKNYRRFPKLVVKFLKSMKGLFVNSLLESIE
jgi:plasmid stabilization system protein ParE